MLRLDRAESAVRDQPAPAPFRLILEPAVSWEDVAVILNLCFHARREGEKQAR
jgi:hypothetical protein